MAEQQKIFIEEANRISHTYDISQFDAVCYLWHYHPILSSDMCDLYNFPCKNRDMCKHIFETEYN